MSISRTFVIYMFVAYLIARTLVIGIAHIVSAGSKYSSGQQKEISVPVVFEPVRFVLDKLF